MTTASRDGTPRAALTAVLVVAAAVRLGFWALGLDDPSQFFALSAADGTPTGDSVEYLSLANDLGAAYLGDRGSDLIALGLVRPPGYPLLLAALSVVGRSLPFLALVHVVLGVGVVWLTYLLGSSLIEPRAGLVAAAIVAVEPASVVHSSLLLTEVPFTLLLVVGALLVVQGLRRGRGEASVARLGLAGGLLGAATLIRPVTLYLPLVLVPVVYALAEGRDRRRRVLAAAVVVAAFAVPVGGWMARNAVTSGLPMLSTIESTNLLYFRAAFAAAEQDGRPVAEVRDEYRATVERRAGRSSDPASRYEFERSLAVRELVAHPVGALTMTVKGAGRTLIGPDRYQVSRRLQVAIDHPVVLLSAYATSAMAGIFCLLAVAGFVRGRRGPRVGAIWISALLAGYLVVISAGGEAYSRFRVPAMPFIALLGAYAVCHVLVPRSAPAEPPRVRLASVGRSSLG